MPLKAFTHQMVFFCVRIVRTSTTPNNPELLLGACKAYFHNMKYGGDCSKKQKKENKLKKYMKNQKLKNTRNTKSMTFLPEIKLVGSD